MTALWEAAVRLSRLINVETVFDVGAHCGDMASYFAKEWPDARLTCFEPDPDVFERLRSQMEPAGATTENVALFSHSGIMPFYRGRFSPTSSLFERYTTGKRYFDSRYTMGEAIQVPVTTLDAYCRAKGIASICLLKLDTQGAELEILRGASDLLEAQAIDIIVTEFFAAPHYASAPLLNEIWSYLQSTNYSLYDLFKNTCGRDGQLRDGDAIFISAAFRQRCLNTLPSEP